MLKALKCSWYLSCGSTSVAWYLNIYIKLHFKRHCEFGIFNNVLLFLFNLPIYIALALLGLLTNYTWLNSSIWPKHQSLGGHCALKAHNFEAPLLCILNLKEKEKNHKIKIFAFVITVFLKCLCIRIMALVQGFLSSVL